jgi:methylenetetrahydrofolate dehydrogenase (NADP+) / methenyltetrahydrofolate cyclohydrolase
MNDQTPLILDGNLLAATIKSELLTKVQARTAKGFRPPHLVAVHVGDNPASASYVRNKIKSCAEAGFRSTLIHKDESLSEEGLLEIVAELNNNPDVDGYIVQLPLPAHINPDRVLLAIDPSKDVDGFHPTNFGKMAQGMQSYIPATPYGILLMLERYNIETAGKHCVVLGRSNIVGMPMSILMGQKRNPGNCTVTLAHSRTKDLKAETLRADILIAAIGIPHFVKADMVKKGVVIIDVGINSIPDASKKSGQRLVGDVDFENVAPLCSAITPVPGGVGPMTVTALLMNTLQANERSV